MAHRDRKRTRAIYVYAHLKKYQQHIHIDSTISGYFRVSILASWEVNIAVDNYVENGQLLVRNIRKHAFSSLLSMRILHVEYSLYRPT